MVDGRSVRDAEFMSQRLVMTGEQTRMIAETIKTTAFDALSAEVKGEMDRPGLELAFMQALGLACGAIFGACKDNGGDELSMARAFHVGFVATGKTFPWGDA